MKAIVLISVMLALFGLTGCSTLQNMLYKEYTKKSDAEKQISDLKEKHRADIDDRIKAVQTGLEKTIQAQDNQIQAGANKLYGANEAFKYYTNPTRLDLIINHRVTEAQAALGKQPTYQAIKEENERLKDELDEKKTSLEKLKANHTDALAKNTELSEATARAKKEVEDLKAAWIEAERKYISNAESLQAKLNSANDAIISLEGQRADDKAAVERMKTKLMIGCGIVAALCVLATIYSPVGKSSLAMAAVVFGGAAAAIPYIEGWMILVAAVVIIAIISAIFLYRHYVADKTTDNLINHIQDLKEDPIIPDDLKAHIKDSLSKWNSKYTEGKNTIEDISVEKYIKSKLKDYGRL